MTHTTVHHIVPRSRESDGQTVRLPGKFHKSWHDVFGNLYGDECVRFIELLNVQLRRRKRITNNDLHRLREKVKDK